MKKIHKCTLLTTAWEDSGLHLWYPHLVFSHLTGAEPVGKNTAANMATNSGETVELQRKPVNFLPISNHEYLHHLSKEESEKEQTESFRHLRSIYSTSHSIYHHLKQQSRCQSFNLAMFTYILWIPPFTLLPGWKPTKERTVTIIFDQERSIILYHQSKGEFLHVYLLPMLLTPGVLSFKVTYNVGQRSMAVVIRK